MHDERKIQGQFKYYVFLSVLYAVIIVTAQAVAYRLIQIGPFLEPGGIFIFPISFAVSDIISEVYGPTLARKTIFVSLFSQAFYSIIPICINQLPTPPAWNHADAYHFIFGSSWLVFISNLVAIFFGMILNTQLIGKTKIIARGRWFPVRSLFSSAIGEFILTAIIVLIALIPVYGFEDGEKFFVNMFLFKVILSIIFLYPASFLVAVFKRLDHVDVYETSITFNPLSNLFKKKGGDNDNVINLFDKKLFKENQK